MNGSSIDRRRSIRRILGQRALSSQEELLQELADLGVHTTQPVLSRELRAMNVAKRGGVYCLDEEVTPLEKLRFLLRGTASAGPNLLVVRCEPGAASAIARALESEHLEGVLGTVAGDDTVFAATAGAEQSKALRMRVEACLA